MRKICCLRGELQRLLMRETTVDHSGGMAVEVPRQVRLFAEERKQADRILASYVVR